ncbi:MAG: sulfite exporter TauE/SafE family protein [Brevundimonas sp.]|nr:sulfite exporter TauE/SafE family protein [Brevundimonas sp.]MDZ4060684.1 sulfite exporter TauE/SafE family protein [Brevundimonas sp.]
MQDFLLFAAVGFAAQLVDGALGMAYGVISSTLLLSLGTPPAAASASVHAAKMFTGAASAASHVRNGNVSFALFWPLALGGAVGGVAGGFLLTSIDAETIKPWVVGWLGLMGVVILRRAMKGAAPRPKPFRAGLPLGLAGGFLDALGGGGWGPTVTTTLVSAGTPPRQAVGSGNAAEAVVAVAVSTTFLVALLRGRWPDADGLQQYLAAVLGLIAGGVAAAPLSGLVARILPMRAFTWLVGLLIIGLAVTQLLSPLLR